MIMDAAAAPNRTPMSRIAYRTTGLAVKALANLSKAQVHIHGEEHLPQGSIIFVVNHFTRIETLLMPYLLNKLTQVPVWSLADYELFRGALGSFLDRVGAVSTRDPDRDRLIVKSLLTGEAHWLIFPEGRMVKNLKIVDKGRFMVSWAGGKHPPHTGAAMLALRTEFYRERMSRLAAGRHPEAERLREVFQIADPEAVAKRQTYILPVNITYYPLRARENILSDIARRLVEDLPDRALDEIMTEGSMLLSGVDIDVRFGLPIAVGEHLRHPVVLRDIERAARFETDDPIRARRMMRREAQALMQRYMAAIYSLATVNHDHLFASILRASPWARIDPYELCGRVFLAAAELRRMGGVHFHRRLEGDQSHLLAYDREGIWADFLALALEKGNLRKTEEGYVKIAKSFTSPVSFHRARIDNPVDIMANAVEPLTGLQRTVRRLAWAPGFWVRRRVADRLLREAREEFESDYRRFYREGESKPMEVGMPFLIEGRSRELGIVLSHGYMAAPLEVRGLAEYLGRLGYWVYAPRLRGHGTAPEDLAARTYQEWVASIDRGYALMRGLCRRVVAGGFSTGAGLALLLASRVKSLAGVFAVSTPLRLRDFAARFAPAVDMWNRFVGRKLQAAPRMEFVENRPENPHINYLRNPVSGVREIERLMDKLEPRLGKIVIPTLIVHSNRDPVVDPKGSGRIFEMLGARDKRYTLFSFERHGILVGPDSEKVYRVIADFLDPLR
jgi:esterase/lipase/1-acyl-sn-glycerol-3-phosphate acyltransferase